MVITAVSRVAYILSGFLAHLSHTERFVITIEMKHFSFPASFCGNQSKAVFTGGGRGGRQEPLTQEETKEENQEIM